MKQPVSTPEFWANRLKDAQQLRHSVFICSDYDWEEINTHHYRMLTKYIDVKKDNVLEAGCGYGRWSPLFKNYTGIDISPDFINLAKEQYPLHANNFLCADLKQLPYQDKKFDWCFTISTKAMIVREINQESWDNIEKELIRVSKNVLILEYTPSLPSNINRDNIEILK